MYILYEISLALYMSINHTCFMYENKKYVCFGRNENCRKNITKNMRPTKHQEGGDWIF